MQGKNNNRALIAEKVSLSISKEKPKVMQNKNRPKEKIRFEGQDLEVVKSCTCLGSIITAIGGTEKDVTCRRSKDRLSLNVLRPVWNASSIYTKLYLCIITPYIIAKLLYYITLKPGR